MDEVALITGASSGIGSELARLHAARGGDVVLVARRQDKLEALKAELERSNQVTVTVMTKDLSAPDAAQALFDEISAAGIEVAYLINNAGFGGHGLFHEREWDQDRTMIQLNILALTALTRLFLPQMVARNRGRILNVASMAGFLPGPLQAVYYATKAYVLSFSEALANELSGTDVTVTVLCPGATETGFATAADVQSVRAFKSGLASAASVAAYGYQAMLKGKTVAVPGAMNKFLVHGLIRVLPRRLVTKISRATMEKE